MAEARYRPAPLASLPATLDPAEYNVSPEDRRLQARRLAIRARLKRQYLLQYDNPHRRALIDDPALYRWTYARSTNVYPNFKPTPKTSLLGAIAGIGPLFFWYYIFKTDRDKKEKLIQEGKLKRPLSLLS
ncbi:NADH dehydrogenase [ubiquinone] 1 beta subcomplex subunit 4 [Ornithorhynchus anatinus]|uniref:NADH dehydrogenase [ubiquinone] 1 beta subcomplex subunit 4 n=1 Tax=Ornithorhynchus anatinus TaxID=9258 RepID=A0A6I8N8X3_ORNAN|nr:NADH dehydrogenase [ubiquinone] 1 beta subcomplex subunit 4 [Ornithorhynchus anatinus]